MDIGTRIKTTREARGMSAAQFAKLVGVSSTAVFNWENHSMEPRTASLANIARALGVSTNYLQTGEEDDEPAFDSALVILDRAKKELAASLRVAPESINLEFKIAI